MSRRTKPAISPVTNDSAISAPLIEAPCSRGADEGDAITAGATSWTTINLAPGRYQLLCNIAGPYGAAMYTELDVAGTS